LKSAFAVSKAIQSREKMMIAKIERIKGGVVVNAVERGEDGLYHCLPKGKNIDAIRIRTLDEVADWLRKNPKAGVRMNPTWTKISKNIFIDGIPR
jgi:hypothetical protein